MNNILILDIYTGRDSHILRLLLIVVPLIRLQSTSDMFGLVGLLGLKEWAKSVHL